MLIVLSDLHLADGSTSGNIRSRALTEVLQREIVQNARDNAKELHLVLLGDIFDLVRTDYWVREVPTDERPWNGTLSQETAMNTHGRVEYHYQNVLRRILRTDASDALFSLITSLERVTGASSRRRLPVSVTIVPGNHDRALHNFSSLRRMIRERVHVADVRFLSGVCAPAYGVLARHGHEWDPHCYGHDLYTNVLRKGARVGRFDDVCYKVQTIGEVVTAELLAGVLQRIREARGHADREFLRQLMEVNNVRPQLDACWWVEWFARSSLSDRRKRLLFEAVHGAVSAVLKTGLARRWDAILNDVFVFRGDLTDRLEQLLRFLEKQSFDHLKRKLRLFQIFSNVFGSGDLEYLRGAEQEWELGLPATIQYVVYGHTHEARHAYLAGYPDGRVRMYINTGTYLPLIQRAQTGGFATSHQMTMTFFYRKDEDKDGKKRRTLSMELWSGIKRKLYTS